MSWGLEKGVNHGDWKAFQMREEKDCLAEAIGVSASVGRCWVAGPDLEGATCFSAWGVVEQGSGVESCIRSASFSSVLHKLSKPQFLFCKTD